MDTEEDFEHQYITSETLYKTYIREENDVVKLLFLFPLYFFVFKQTTSHLTTEVNLHDVYGVHIVKIDFSCLPYTVRKKNRQVKLFIMNRENENYR